MNSFKNIAYQILKEIEKITENLSRLQDELTDKLG